MSATGSAYLALRELDQIRPTRLTSRGETGAALGVILAVFLLMWLAAALGTWVGGPDCLRYEDGTSVCGQVVTCQVGAGCDS